MRELRDRFSPKPKPEVEEQEVASEVDDFVSQCLDGLYFDVGGEGG